ncbi:hypothetical protein BGY98DRAFT_1102363 [Russula aff. rugulosa BPL654]|nr:hypothetical protein BGY98DRAFT_1102363 [Russula aff. rugulosa BPL654]
MSQGLDIQLEILQTLLTVIRLLANVRALLPLFAARDAFAIFEDLTFTIELIESVHMNNYQLLRKVCLSSLPIRDFIPSSNSYYNTTSSPLLLESLSKRSAFPLAFRGTRIVFVSVFLMLKQFLSELKTETKISLTPLIKLIIGETAGGPRSGLMLMRALAMEIMRRLCSDVELMCSVRQRYDALATGGGASSASSAHVLTLLISAHKNLVTSRPACSASLRGCTEWELLASDSQSHLHSHHSLDSVTGDGGGGCQRDSFERRWDDWQRQA